MLILYLKIYQKEYKQHKITNKKIKLYKKKDIVVVYNEIFNNIIFFLLLNHCQYTSFF